MLMKNPEQFQRVAREWAVKHAGAPKTTHWSEKAATAAPTQSKPKSHRSREEELRLEAARQGLFLGDMICTNITTGIKATTRTSSTGSCLWDSILTELWKHSTMSTLTEITVKTTNLKKHTWGTSLPDCLENLEQDARSGFPS